MWNELPEEEKETYKRLILAYASFSQLNSQKSSDYENISPVIASKFQETVFAYSFNATEEDIGNTSYDASVKIKNKDGTITKCLVGIKTFGIESGAQKIAQFKANTKEWSPIFSEIEDASKGITDKKKIDELNEKRYLSLAHSIAHIRNKRIESSIENLKGFDVTDQDKVESIYHTLMPSGRGKSPQIFVGETSYTKIDEEHLKVEGCTTSNHPQNFAFSDGHHSYRYTSADSQLLMDFNNADIVQETWNVKYITDPIDLFLNIYNRAYDNNEFVKTTKEQVVSIPKITESYSWKIANKDGNVELFSGWNGFYGIGSKLSKNDRLKRVHNLHDKYQNIIPYSSLGKICDYIQCFLTDPAPTYDEKMEKVKLRDTIMKYVAEAHNDDLKKDVSTLLFRPVSEMYIPIPDSKKFHTMHPNFFGKNLGQFDADGRKMKYPKKPFKLTFEPSGDTIDAFITQDYGKALESSNKQSILGEWILRKVFQLDEYEPLTSKKLTEIGLNGYRLYRTDSDDSVHLKFIWINDELPSDYQEK